MAYYGMWVVIVITKRPELGGVCERFGSVEEMRDSGKLSTFQVGWGCGFTGRVGILGSVKFLENSARWKGLSP